MRNGRSSFDISRRVADGCFNRPEESFQILPARSYISYDTHAHQPIPPKEYKVTLVPMRFRVRAGRISGMATPRLAPPKITLDVHHLGKKPLPETTLTDLKVEIMNLMKEDKRYRYELGRKLDILQKERSRGRTGTFMRDLKDMKINYHKANRLIKFYRRAQLFFAVRKAEGEALDAKNAKAGWIIEDAADFERALESQEADKKLAALNILADVERDKVKKAQRVQGPKLFRVGLGLSDAQRAKFKKAWDALTEDRRTKIVYRAVLSAND